MKKLFVVLGLLIFGAILWYLFIKSHDYLVRFKVNTSPGVVNQTIKNWSSSLENSQIISSDTIFQVNQELMIDSIKTRFNWEITPESDSTSSVKVYATDINNSFKNKVQIPFSETFFEKETKSKLLNFNSLLKEHLSVFKVGEVKKDTLEATNVLYVEIKTTQQKKAKGMMENYPFLDQLMAFSSSLKPNGLPFIEVTYWNQKNDSLHYNFCYPVMPTDKRPDNKEVKYKLFKGGKALKTEYNGNYMTSDRAWYKILDYADKNSISTTHLPIEVFYTNPNNGGDELNWKTEVFLIEKN